MTLSYDMRREIAAVIYFLKKLIKYGEKLEPEKVDLFVERLAIALQDKFKGHWYPDNPTKGQAYRCIRVNRFSLQDPELLRACEESGIRYNDLGLPREFSLWVDPGEVCWRYAEHNPCFSITNFSPDLEDKDVARTVNTALERVTSDYHSGSSSDEESSQCSQVTAPNNCCTTQTMNPFAPSWHPKRPLQGKSHPPPRSHFDFRPRNKPHLSQQLWYPPGCRRGPGYWDSSSNLPHYYG